MIIAVTSAGSHLYDNLDPRFGRADQFILFNNATGEWRVVDNTQSKCQAQGAGIQAAQTIADAGANVLITGHCGPRAYRALEAADIDVVTGARGTVAEVLAAFDRGELQRALAPDVESHWL